ncbi:MAG: hypothetical protein HY880_00885 [Deltaproteobacteria bacterium]|nr:hypothetical protein [Deltaproteobacteria bacterium]
MARNFSRAIIVLFAATFILADSPVAETVLDRESIECMNCHSGYHGKGFSHPLGVDYGDVYRKDHSLISIDSLDQRLRLVDNKISCTTCHMQYLKDTHVKGSASSDPMLVIDNDGSSLCLACHKK